MKLDDDFIQRMKSFAGGERCAKADTYVKNHKIEILSFSYIDEGSFEILAKVKGKGNETYQVEIKLVEHEIEKMQCECLDCVKDYNICKHMISVLEEFQDNPIYDKIAKENTENNKHMLKELVDAFYYQTPLVHLEEKKDLKKGIIRVVPFIKYHSNIQSFSLECKIGSKVLYKIEDIGHFYECMKYEKCYRYGARLELIHKMEVFEEQSKEFVKFLMKYGQIIKYVNENNGYTHRYYEKALNPGEIKIDEIAIDELFEIFSGKQIEFQVDDITQEVEFRTKAPLISFLIEEKEDSYQLKSTIPVQEYHKIKGDKAFYFLYDHYLYRCSKEFEETTLKLLDILKKNKKGSISFTKEGAKDFFSYVYPSLKRVISIDKLSQESVQNYIPRDLTVKVFLDYDKQQNMIGEIKFCYGNQEINPFSKEPVAVPRDRLKEKKALELIQKVGFTKEKGSTRLKIVDKDQIYEFLSDGINEFMKQFEILVTEDFKAKQIRVPKINSLGVRIENNLLNIDLSGIQYPKEELIEILKQYKVKKKYYRLKDGSFLNLENNQDLAFMDSLMTGMDIQDQEIEDGNVTLPIYRGLYLERLLEKYPNDHIKKDKQYKQMMDQILDKDSDQTIKVPEELETVLRSYQVTGYKWLKMLDYYNFGGILADDMGLRKNDSNFKCFDCLSKRSSKTRTQTIHCYLSKFFIS